MPRHGFLKSCRRSRSGLLLLLSLAFAFKKTSRVFEKDFFLFVCSFVRLFLPVFVNFLLLSVPYLFLCVFLSLLPAFLYVNHFYLLLSISHIYISVYISFIAKSFCSLFRLPFFSVSVPVSTSFTSNPPLFLLYSLPLVRPFFRCVLSVFQSLCASVWAVLSLCFPVPLQASLFLSCAFILFFLLLSLTKKLASLNGKNNEINKWAFFQWYFVLCWGLLTDDCQLDRHLPHTKPQFSANVFSKLRPHSISILSHT